jgi:hypothetical protein
MQLASKALLSFGLHIFIVGGGCTAAVTHKLSRRHSQEFIDEFGKFQARHDGLF